MLRRIFAFLLLVKSVMRYKQNIMTLGIAPLPNPVLVFQSAKHRWRARRDWRAHIRPQILGQVCAPPTMRWHERWRQLDGTAQRRAPDPIDQALSEEREHP